MHLFFLGVTSQVDDLHPVQQRLGNIAPVVGGGYEHDLGEVKGAST